MSHIRQGRTGQKIVERLPDPGQLVVERTLIGVAAIRLAEQTLDPGKLILERPNDGQKRNRFGRTVEAKAARPTALRRYEIGGRQPAEDLCQKLGREIEFIGDFGRMECAFSFAKGEKGEGADRVNSTA